MRNKKKILALVTAFLVTSSAGGYAEGEGEGGTQWGPFRAKPRVDLEYISTDNYFNEQRLIPRNSQIKHEYGPCTAIGRSNRLFFAYATR